MGGLLFATTLGAALACGLAAGSLFVFSAFVMPGLERLPAAEGIAAMQSINRTAVTPPFMLVFLGAAIACTALVVVAVLGWGEPHAPWLLAGGVVYVLGAFVLTIACNVPLNDALAELDPQSADAAARWAAYVSDWTRWNHIRSAAALVAAGLLTVGLTVG